MRSEIKRLHQRLGATIIYVTHDQVEAMTLADRIAVLSGGHLMQYDTPETIYNRPAALFVAGFTGAPAMNLCDCAWVDGQADLGGVRVSVMPELAARAAVVAKLKFGVRPENIMLAPITAEDQAVPAQVQLLEPLGAETLVTLRIGQADMVARCPASFRGKPGTQITAYLRAPQLHVFDAANGTAL
jgi:multiple sugar transport system ATP-binding protein